MMIEKYISDLLYRYQCVTVPNFGAFIAENISAQVKGSASTFLPPQKVISFNTNIKNNDGLLANHIATNEKISYDKAMNKIANQVAIWNAQLISLDTIALKNIGNLHLNGESNVVFEPTNTVNFLTTAFAYF